MSRGLRRAEAEHLIVEGFFRKVLDSCAIAGATDYINALLAEKIHAQGE
jgi:Fe-S cluster assembly scaffold protein SufB